MRPREQLIALLGILANGDNPVCEAAIAEIERLRARLAKAERVCKAVKSNDAAIGSAANAYSGKQVIISTEAMRQTRLELDEALEARERENG